MDATNQLGIYVPHFCYHKKLSIAANCRMCLVQVEKAPKPLPACATPVAEGMKVQTHSEQAVTAQKGVMEFLLINHPLDCPICDQGGECQLQDLAVGYGGIELALPGREARRLPQERRTADLDGGDDALHPLHALRPLRPGDRRDHGARDERPRRARGDRVRSSAATVDSELSGNMIDLCPVGALTSKPFRYNARTWELARRQVDRAARQPRLEPRRPGQGRSGAARAAARERGGQRVLAVGQGPVFVRRTECAGPAPAPMIERERRVEGNRLADRAATMSRTACRTSSGEHGADAIAALVSPHMHARGNGAGRRAGPRAGVGQRRLPARQADFRADGTRSGTPWLGMPIAARERRSTGSWSSAASCARIIRCFRRAIRARGERRARRSTSSIRSMTIC